MASIERTVYPRFKATLSAQELQTLYAPTEEEREFVATHAWTDTHQLTLLTLLKCHQRRFPQSENDQHFWVFQRSSRVLEDHWEIL